MKIAFGFMFCVTLLSTFFNAAIAENRCPKNAEFEYEGGTVCAYDVVIHAANTVRENSVFEFPGQVMIEVFGVILGPIGQLAKDSFYNEGRHYYVNLTPSKGHENYLLCHNEWEIWSETGTKNYDNRNLITLQKGHYEWELNKPKIFQGRNWYKADFVWVSRHPSFPEDKSECKSIAETVLAEMRKLRPSDPPAKPDKRIGRPGIGMPGGPPS